MYKRQPDEWAYIKKTYPYYKADADVYIKAIEQAKKLKAETLSKRLSKGLQAVQWQFAGPTNVGGRVVDIEFDPTNPSIVYAGFSTCLLYTSDAADERSSVDLGGRRIIKKQIQI